MPGTITKQMDPRIALAAAQQLLPTFQVAFIDPLVDNLFATPSLNGIHMYTYIYIYVYIGG